ncbi:MAG: hypothetical protein SVV80_03830 [Planctomycetota bacterium]|nr:hypothetical protein [Planctomycetota bacterium]
MGDGSEPMEDDEYLYRRILLQYFNPSQGSEPSPKAFRPRKHDETGLSVFRAKYVTPEQVAQNDRGKRYYVARLRAGDLRDNGIKVVPRIEGHEPGHAELPDLTYDNRSTDVGEEAQQLLARRLCLEVLGPFPRQA